jgi:hypothetical protein
MCTSLKHLTVPTTAFAGGHLFFNLSTDSRFFRRDGRAYILPTNLETLIVYFSDEMLLSLDRLKQSFAHTKVAKPKLRAIAAIQYLERPELSDCEHDTDYVELGREAVIQFCVLR